MRDYTVPHTKAEDFRERLLWFSYIWPMVAAFLGIVYGWWVDKCNGSFDAWSIFCSILFGLFAMMPISFFWTLITFPEIKDCHPEYNTIGFYWQYIISLNLVPLMIVGMVIAACYGC